MSRAFAPGLLVAAIVCLLWIASDYSTVWVHPEYLYILPHHLLPDKHLTWRDLLEFFDCNALGEQCVRARFVAYLVTRVTIKGRVLLWQFVPPHPSLSLAWLFSIGSLFLFYKTVVLLVKRSDVALTVTGLYIVSVGFLSHFSVLLWGAKELVCFFMIAALYCAAKIERGSASPSLWILLYSSLAGAILSDEIGWVMLAIVPVFAPSLFARGRQVLWWRVTSYLLLFVGIILFLSFAAPAMGRYLFDQKFDFWHWMSNPNYPAFQAKLSFLDRFSTSAILTGAYNMAADLLTVRGLGYDWTLWVTAALIVGMASAAEDKWLVVRLVAILCGYIIFQGLLTLLRADTVGYPTSDTFYYGSSFPIFALLVLAAVMTSRFGRAIAYGLVPFIFLASILNFFMVNAKFEAQSYVSVRENQEFGRPLTFAKVYGLWNSIQSTDADIASFALQLSKSNLWLLREMEFVRRR